MGMDLGLLNLEMEEWMEEMCGGMRRSSRLGRKKNLCLHRLGPRARQGHSARHILGLLGPKILRD